MDTDPEQTTVPDTAMATGNDDSPPGDVPRGPLDAEERAVLAELRQGGGEPVIGTAAEDSPAVERAVQDDSVVREG